jgi:AcrR family transcriptional regulator
MSTKSPPPSGSARDRLLAAANQLFYEEGVRAVGIDRVIEQAGVAKASLYTAFGSKEELVRSYLQVRHAARRARLERKLAGYATPREKLLGVFDLLAEVTREESFRGCAFLRADAETLPGSAVKEMCDVSRGWLRGVLIDLAREAGAPDPGRLAAQLSLLYDGVMVAVQMDGNHAAAIEARTLAGDLVAAALPA